MKHIGYVQLKLLTQQNYFVIDIYGDLTMLQTPENQRMCLNIENIAN